jgi:formylmethanofuran dehydrogenase subunit A
VTCVRHAHVRIGHSPLLIRSLFAIFGNTTLVYSYTSETQLEKVGFFAFCRLINLAKIANSHQNKSIGNI